MAVAEAVGYEESGNLAKHSNGTTCHGNFAAFLSQQHYKRLTAKTTCNLLHFAYEKLSHNKSICTRTNIYVCAAMTAATTVAET